jgi:hypothetical protein
MPMVLRPTATAGRIAVAGVLLGALGLTGCGAVTRAANAVHAVRSDKKTLDTFTSTIKTGQGAAFEAVYASSGPSPATVVYAVKPPTGLAFQNTVSGSTAGVGGVDIIVNRSGEYSCSRTAPSGSKTGWQCTKLGAASAADENQIFDFYTPDHWIKFLRGFSLAAGLAGDSVTSSTMTANGFRMSCVDFRAPGVPGQSTICTTRQGVLGYVKVASDTTTFEIERFSASPADALFQLPPGALVTSLPSPTTT